MISCPDHLLQLRSIKNPRGRATSTISTSTTIWLSCLLALWGPDQTLLTHIKVVTFIILSRRVLTSQATNESFANYVLKSDTPRKSVGLAPDSLLQHSGLRRISWLLQLLLNLIGLWIRAPLITSPLIFKTCPSTTTMTEMKISSSVTVKEFLLLILVPQRLVHLPQPLHSMMFCVHLTLKETSFPFLNSVNKIIHQLNSFLTFFLSRI